MSTPRDTPGLVKPFTAQVSSAGTATAIITQTTHGLCWVVYQVGFALGQRASNPQVAAHFNSQPLVATTPMQVSAFSSIAGAAPYAMESFFYGPPYCALESGDQIVCAVLGAVPGDVFTATAYVNEIESPATSRAKAANSGYSSGHVSRAGMRRWLDAGSYRQSAAYRSAG